MIKKVPGKEELKIEKGIDALNFAKTYRKESFPILIAKTEHINKENNLILFLESKMYDYIYQKTDLEREDLKQLYKDAQKDEGNKFNREFIKRSCEFSDFDWL